MEKIHVLLAEDDFDFGSILKLYLNVHDFVVTWVKDGKEAFEIFQENKRKDILYDICVLDVMMPKIDGFNLAEKIIQIQPDIPFVFLTARKLREDKIRGLKLGADDYIIKPFDADILVLRLRNILKRTRRNFVLNKSVNKYNIGTYLFDPENHLLEFKGNIQQLTARETQLIQYLVEHKNMLIKRDTLLLDVWGSDDFFSGRSMDVFLSRLRKYFRDDHSITLESTRGVGLTFKIPKTSGSLFNSEN